MKTNHSYLYFLLGVSFLTHPIGVLSQSLGNPIKQTDIARVNMMPNIPSSYKMLDWKSKSKAFDGYVFDWHRNNSVGPLIWLDNSHRNFGQSAFGLYTAVKDIRQGLNNDGEFHVPSL